MVIDHCFVPVGLHRIEMAIRPENSNSLRVVEKLGIREVGYAPQLPAHRRRLARPPALRDDRGGVPGGLLARLETPAERRLLNHIGHSRSATHQATSRCAGPAAPNLGTWI